MSTKQPTAKQKRYWSALCEDGCIIAGCLNPPAIHHCETGGGGRKDHDKVIPLCYYHHQGKEGTHTLSRRVWQSKYGTEQELMQAANNRINMP